MYLLISLAKTSSRAYISFKREGKYSCTLCTGGNNTQSIGEGPAGHLSRVANVYLPGGAPQTLTVGETETPFERGLCEWIHENLSGSFDVIKIILKLVFQRNENECTM